MPSSSVSRPLIVTDDPELLDDLLRLSAAADIAVTVAHTVAHAGREWPRAPLVVVGTDLLVALASLDLDRRPHVVVAGRDLGSDPGRGAGAGTNAHESEGEVWDAALRIGAREVLPLPDREAHLADLLAEATEERPGSAMVVPVVGGKGGAGASVMAVALALAGVRAGMRTALIDADPLGSGLDLLIGEEHAGGTRWDDLAERDGRMHWPTLRDAFPHVQGLTLVTWSRERTTPVPASAMRAVLSSAARGTDLLVCDLPRTVDPCTEEVLRRGSVTLLVVPAEVHAVMAACRVAPLLRDRVTDLRVAIRGASPSLPADAVSLALQLPVAGVFPNEPGLDACIESGRPPATRPATPLAEFCASFLDDLADEHRTAIT